MEASQNSQPNVDEVRGITSTSPQTFSLAQENPTIATPFSSSSDTSHAPSTTEVPVDQPEQPKSALSSLSIDDLARLAELQDAQTGPGDSDDAQGSSAVDGSAVVPVSAPSQSENDVPMGGEAQNQSDMAATAVDGRPLDGLEFLAQLNGTSSVDPRLAVKSQLPPKPQTGVFHPSLPAKPSTPSAVPLSIPPKPPTAADQHSNLPVSPTPQLPLTPGFGLPQNPSLAVPATPTLPVTSPSPTQAEAGPSSVPTLVNAPAEVIGQAPVDVSTSVPPQEPSPVSAPAPAPAPEQTGAHPSQEPSVSEIEASRQAALASRKPRETPQTKLATLKQRIEKDPLDGEAWTALIADTEAKGDLDKIREVYEAFLKVFPDAAKKWIAYAESELSHSLFDRTEAIFRRCLPRTASWELIRFYLTYVRRVNPIDPSDAEKAAKAKAEIVKAFEFAVGHVGVDREAGVIWTEYIAFLKETEARGGWEGGQKIDALRKVYQRAVSIPLNNVEAIWQEYNQFEISLNKTTAKNFLQRCSPAYQTAKTALPKLRSLTEALLKPEIPRRPHWANPRDSRAVQAWKQYLKWEESNPLEIDDPSALYTRVAFAYKKAMMFMRFYPEIWYAATSYFIRAGKEEEAVTVCKAGLEANPSSLLIGFLVADLEEGRNKKAEAYKVYENLRIHFTKELEDLKQADNATNAATNGNTPQAIQAEEAMDVDGRDVKENGHTGADEAPKDLEAERRQAEMEELRKTLTNVWIMEMRFARRAEGAKAAREVFAKARKTDVAWQIFVASALMEHCDNMTKVATNVFELGAKKFGDNPSYILQYLQFLIGNNDSNNARALFERFVSKNPPEKSRSIWDMWLQYEQEFSDLAAVKKLEARYLEAYPEDEALDLFIQSHGYMGLDDVPIKDLGRSMYGDDRRDLTPPDARQNLPDQTTIAPAARLQEDRVQSPDRGNRDEDFSRGDRSGRGGGRGGRGGRRDSPSPAPSSSYGRGRRDRDREEPDRRGGYRRPRSPVRRPSPPVRPPPVEEKLPPPRPSLPEAITHFLGILPTAATFTGPRLAGNMIADVLLTARLPEPAPRPPVDVRGPQPSSYYSRPPESPPRRMQQRKRGRSPDYSDYPSRGGRRY